MRPEEAQEQTENRWAALISGQEEPPCGWCIFAFELLKEDGFRCHLCPIHRLCGMHCCNTDEFNRWAEEGTEAAAQDIYDKLVANRDTLIEMGREILREQAVRD